MDTKRLRQFCVIAETGSLTKAAQLLHITHSGLSKSMRILQEDLHRVLFQPAGRGLSLTNDGLQLYQSAKKFLDYEEQLFKINKEASQATLRIATVEIFHSILIEQLDTLSIQNPLTFLDLVPGNMEQLLADKQLDFAITYAPFPMENIEITELGSYQLSCYHLQGKFTHCDFAALPFVVPAQGLSSNPLGIKERDGWLESLYPRNKKFLVNQLAIAMELTLMGLCAIHIPDFIAHKINASRLPEDQLVEYSTPEIPKTFHSAFILKHKDQPINSPFQQLCQGMSKALKL